MPLNMPVGSTDNISFGPAKVYMGAWASGSGVSPTIDVGYIGEDGVSIELTSEKKNITQGNPQLVEYSFVQTQSVMINFTSIQWNFENFRFALGAGVTAGPADALTFSFGGDPINILTAVHIEHEMAVTGNTLDIYAWKCQSESGFSIPLGQDEHQFEFSFTVLRADTDWNDVTLPKEQQLLRMKRTA